METKSMDLTRWEKGIDVLRKSFEKVKTSPYSKSERLFFELYLKYFERLNKAMMEGEDIIGHPTSFPSEIIYAMGATPMLITSSVCTMFLNVGNIRESLDAASELGLMLETCSAHRAINAWFYKRWVPPFKAVVHMGGICDAFSNSNRIPAEIYDLPQYYVDLPYYADEKGIKHLAQEFEDAAHFVEEQLQRKMDLDRLKEVIKLSEEMVRLHKEIGELKKNVPSPLESRLTWYVNWFNWIYAGTPEGVTWFRTLRDELKERVEQKKGAVQEERFRLMDLFVPPLYAFVDLYNAWEREFGAVVVHAPFTAYWRGWEGEMDLSRPFESLSRKWHYGQMRVFNGPAAQYCEDLIEDAREYKIDGAIWWVQNACAQVGLIRPVKDILKEKLDILTLTVECDLLDKSLVSPERIQENCEDFFEILEGRKSS